MNGPTSTRRVVRDYWKVPAIGLLAGVLAFVGSFAFGSQYLSETRLLVRGREATFLTSNGTNISNQPGVVDASLATALSDTESALLGSRTVAEMVVDDLKLDQLPPKKRSALGKAKHSLSDFYKRSKAVVTHGFYASPDKHDAAVDLVYASIGASQVKGSYVIQLGALADDPKLAAAIANSAADNLVKLGGQRFATDAGNYRDFLKKQLDDAAAQSTAATKAVSDYKAAHNLTNVDTQTQLTVQSLDQIRRDLQTTTADLASAQSQLASLQQSLAKTSSQETTSQTIQTGRSATAIQTSAQNVVFASLSTSVQQAQAQVSGLVAKRDALSKLLASSSGAGAPLTKDAGELSQLVLSQSIASQTFTNLSDQYNQAVLSAANPPVELSRVDTASTPVYPVKPVRYFYLLVGLVFGAAAAALWCYMRARRVQLEADEPIVLDAAPLDGVIDLTDAHHVGSDLVPVSGGGPTEGHPNGNGSMTRAPNDGRVE